MNFKRFFNESINFNSQIVTIPKGETLYHGTIESFDSRKTTTSGYDEVFWTTNHLIIARTYIPDKTSYMNTSVNSIIKDEKLRKSLGLTQAIINLAWQKHQEGYQKLKYWDDKNSEFAKMTKEYEKAGDIHKLTDDFFQQWMQANNNYKKYQQEWKTYDIYLKMFIVQKMRAFGYEPTGYSKDYFEKIMTDKAGNLLPRNTKSIGKVLKVTCKRDFKFFNHAYQQEGDLTDVDYHKINLFRKKEKEGYDGIIINDFAQSEHHGNYGHISIGFFKNSIKDLIIKQIRNQTHPDDKDWNAL